MWRGRRLTARYFKYFLTVLMSSVLTVRFLSTWRGSPSPVLVLPQGVSRGLLSDSDRDSNVPTPPADVLVTKPRRNIPLKSYPKGGWVVLPGNVTMHVGKEANPHNYSYILNSRDCCQDMDASRPGLLVYVESEVKNAVRRQAIRDTWGLPALQRALNFRVVFLLGAAPGPKLQERVLQESFRYGDIVQEDFPESFRQLSLKSVMGLKWATSFCRQAHFLMKTDDDLFIHMPNLLRAISEFAPLQKRYLLCHENRVRRILRKQLLKHMPETYAKYEVREGDLPGMYFPQYCAGMAYIFSQQVAQLLYETALETPYFFIEDVYITGFCRQKANLSISNTLAITLKPPILPRQGSCAFRDGRITSQELSAGEMRELWAEVNTQGYFCPQVVGYVAS